MNCLYHIFSPYRVCRLGAHVEPGDVPVTYADASALERDFGFVPKITLREGLRKFAEWYKQYYK